MGLSPASTRGAGLAGAELSLRLAAARKQAASREILLWMTPSEAPKALQAADGWLADTVLEPDCVTPEGVHAQPSAQLGRHMRAPAQAQEGTTPSNNM